MAKRIVLVSCVKTKQKRTAPACELYTSTLFQGMRRYAEREGDAWYILSAKHGVLCPDKVVTPYELTLKTMRKVERVKWAERVRRQLLDLLPPNAEVIILASEAYRKGIIGFLEENGFKVTVPMTGLGFGRQLSWLKKQTA